MESCSGEVRKRGRVRGSGEGDEPPPAAKRGRMWHPPPQHPHPASRIYRVSRASGGKDRHSKVYTAKGIRDRRVRLSVATAIQFYDLQDRLGYDQPSKAIEWLIAAAADAIDKLPSLDNNNFPSHPASSIPAAAADAAAGANSSKEADAAELGGGGGGGQKSGCSSTSETSKGSVLSLSRSESRVKARERARGRSAAAKDGNDDAARRAPAGSSFTELLTGMMSPAVADHKPPPPPISSSSSSWTTADYIGFARKPSSALPHTFASPAPHLAGVTQQHYGLPAAAGAVTVAAAEMPHLSFLQQDHHFTPAAAGDYNLNFSMSSGGGGGLMMGVNSRGTLQSNSHISSAHHQLSSTTPPLDAAPNIPFLFTPAPTAADTQFAAAFQLWNGFHHHADIKDKGKN